MLLAPALAVGCPMVLKPAELTPYSALALAELAERYRRIGGRSPLDELTPLIDWSPFFHTWELKGRYPAIFDDATVGAAVRFTVDLMTARRKNCGNLRTAGSSAR